MVPQPVGVGENADGRRRPDETLIGTHARSTVRRAGPEDVLDTDRRDGPVDLGRRIVERCLADPDLAHTADVLVRHRGRVVFDRRLAAGKLRNTYSLTKTVTALLVGIAVDERLVDGVDVVVEPAAVTVGDLLSMRRGAVADADDIDRVRELPGGWRRAVAEVPRDVVPGSTFRYDNLGYEALGYWLADRIGRSLESFAAERLFGPLGIREWSWPVDPDGYSWASGELRLSADALGRIGQLVLDHGSVGDPRVQVVSENWVAGMRRPSSAGGPPEGLPYGWGLWVGPDRLLMGGWAGQHVAMFPDDDIVVVTTGVPELLAPTWRPAYSLLPPPGGGPCR